MAIDRHGAGLVTLRILIGVFFLFEGIGKLHWFADSSALARQLDGWLRAVSPTSISAHYLTRFVLPHTVAFARLVPIGELSSGLAMLFGFWTSLFAFIAFCMVLNFHIASGAIFTYSFLTNGYGLPVLGSTLALALGGARLPWSIRA